MKRSSYLVTKLYEIAQYVAVSTDIVEWYFYINSVTLIPPCIAIIPAFAIK